MPNTLHSRLLPDACGCTRQHEPLRARRSRERRGWLSASLGAPSSRCDSGSQRARVRVSAQLLHTTRTMLSSLTIACRVTFLVWRVAAGRRSARLLSPALAPANSLTAQIDPRCEWQERTRWECRVCVPSTCACLHTQLHARSLSAARTLCLLFSSPWQPTFPSRSRRCRGSETARVESHNARV